VPDGAALIIEAGFTVIGRQGWSRLLAHADRVAPRQAAWPHCQAVDDPRRYSVSIGRRQDQERVWPVQAVCEESG